MVGDQVVHAFFERLAVTETQVNELDLPTLSLELAAVADSAVKPTTTSLWLRGGPT